MAISSMDSDVVSSRCAAWVRRRRCHRAPGGPRWSRQRGRNPAPVPGSAGRWPASERDGPRASGRHLETAGSAFPASGSYPCNMVWAYVAALVPGRSTRTVTRYRGMGGSVGPYLHQLREFSGDTFVRDLGLLASEGRMSIPLEDGTSSGVLDCHSPSQCRPQEWPVVESVPGSEGKTPGVRATAGGPSHLTRIPCCCRKTR